jgi:hypothetical protein
MTTDANAQRQIKPNFCSFPKSAQAIGDAREQMRGLVQYQNAAINVRFWG